jgi:hypothetical protein
MGTTLPTVQRLVELRQVRISLHGYDELSADGLLAGEILAGVGAAIEVEDYPTFAKGACVLVRQALPNGDFVHVVWGIARNTSQPAVLVTAYKPDPLRWDTQRLRRR